MNVIQMGQVKDLLANWEGVRRQILIGRVDGFALTLRAPDGSQSMYLGGHYQDNHEDAARVALLTSWEMTRSA